MPGSWAGLCSPADAWLRCPGSLASPWGACSCSVRAKSHGWALSISEALLPRATSTSGFLPMRAAKVPPGQYGVRSQCLLPSAGEGGRGSEGPILCLGLVGGHRAEPCGGETSLCKTQGKGTSDGAGMCCLGG